MEKSLGKLWFVIDSSTKSVVKVCLSEQEAQDVLSEHQHSPDLSIFKGTLEHKSKVKLLELLS